MNIDILRKVLFAYAQKLYTFEQEGLYEREKRFRFEVKWRTPMKVREVIDKMKTEKLLDDRELLVYATKQGGIDDVVGTSINIAALSIYNDTLYIHRAALDNSYRELLGVYELSDIKIIKSQAGFFCGDFIFEYEDKQEHYTLPSKSEKFSEFLRIKDQV